MDEPRISNIVIAGGGTAGWMTAAAFAKTLGTNNYRIVLVESDMIGTVGVGEATIPMITLFNNVLQINEDEFIRETNATFKLGIEFRNWRRLEHSYFHPFGNIGVDMDGIPFTHFWMRWFKSGGNLDYTKFNAETEAARELKFERTAPQQVKRLPDINYAYHFDATLYAAYLRKYAEKRGVIRKEGLISNVVQDPGKGDIVSLTLQDGSIVEGDFFIDCTGFRGLLIEETFGAGYHDWSHWLPVDRAAAVPFETSDGPPPFTRSIADEAGWQWRIPLQHRMGSGHVFCSEFMSDDAATNRLMETIEGDPIAEPRVLRFTTGVRKKAWIRNCVAVGLSNGFLEPLESTSIHLIQVAIAKILAMFPREGVDDRLIARYNSKKHFEYENVKDFLIAHYHVTEREDTPFWQYVRNMQIPDSLQEKLEIFRTRGEILVRQNELFKEASWFAVLAGQGLFPESYHPVADAISEDDLRLRLTQLRSGISERINNLPLHKDYIKKLVEQSRQPRNANVFGSFGQPTPSGQTAMVGRGR